MAYVRHTGPPKRRGCENLKHIQEWLGHSDFTTTANIYAHLDYKSKITSAQAMETGLALPEGGDFSSRWSSISAGENS